MKKIRVISLIVLAVTSFISLDLLFNLLGSLIPSINDGIGIHGILCGNLFFGDSLWSQERFFQAFVISSLISFSVFVENIALAIIALSKKVN